MADEPKTKDADVARFCERFHASRATFVAEHGPEAYDQGAVLYVDDAGETVMVLDAFYGPQPEGPVDAFLGRLVSDWWVGRQTLRSDDGRILSARAGLYARYLGEVGFDWVVELGAAGVERCSRRDGRGRQRALAPPEDESMFRDQTGTFFDLRAGWRWLVEAQRDADALVVCEVQPGYVVGVRPGVPGDDDPGAREDPELEHAFSRFAPGHYDTLEFLGGAVAARYPFHTERYHAWLGDAAAAADAGAIELFVLADSERFADGLRDLCERRGIEAAIDAGDEEEPPRIELHHGPIRLEVDFSYPFLRALHTGRSFVEGARAFYLPVVQALDEAHELLRAAAEVLPERRVTCDGVVMAIGGLGRWNLMGLAGRLRFRGSEGREALRSFLNAGDTADLTVCPVCRGEARVAKVVRPRRLVGDAELVGVAVGDHVVCYTLEDEAHSTPVSPGAARTVATLEAAYAAGLDRARVHLLEARRISGASLLVAFDAGSLVLEPGLLKAALLAAELPADGARTAYAFFPDVVVVADAPLGGRALLRARAAAMEAVQGRFPGRTWPLDLARPVDLEAAPAGTVTVEPS